MSSRPHTHRRPLVRPGSARRQRRTEQVWRPAGAGDPGYGGPTSSGLRRGLTV